MAKDDKDPEKKDAPGGVHPFSLGVGATGGGAAGAAIGGAVGGPVGAAVGAAVGAVAAGLGARAAAESLNPSLEHGYWRQRYASRPYARKGEPYETYKTAYEYGWQARMMHGDRAWEDVERQLEAGWPDSRGDSKLEWADARHAAKDAWDRVGPAPGADDQREPH